MYATIAIPETLYGLVPGIIWYCGCFIKIRNAFIGREYRIYGTIQILQLVLYPGQVFCWYGAYPRNTVWEVGILPGWDDNPSQGCIRNSPWIILIQVEHKG